MTKITKTVTRVDSVLLSYNNLRLVGSDYRHYIGQIRKFLFFRRDHKKLLSYYR